ncbi:BA75_04900T0 [Komagataella pastoris]|uniref:Man(5)GlcNAc(2)-PP-dolichol translocation protein RFT1 n=1 Tax=Komagataella pastoris TaxID=4922 RepID=A0A1B2JI81_PICPA|nr:BA75_04900T0 [Komagataella pastoris]
MFSQDELDTTATKESKDSFSKSASGASFLMMTQLSSKLCTFFINQLLMSYISARILGTTSYIDFLVATSLFFSREAVRLSCQRIKLPKEKAYQAIFNLSLIPLMIGVPFSSILIYTQFIRQQNPAILQSPLFRYSVGFMWLSVIIELLSEPLYNINQYDLDIKKRSKIEGFANVFKCLSQLGMIVWFEHKFKGMPVDKANPDYFIFSYCVSLFIYAASILTLYLHFFFKSPARSEIRFQLTRIDDWYFEPRSISYWKNIFVQIFFKHVLTEGDKFIVNYLCSPEEQGIFALVNNYGSLITRMVFAPIEESLRLYFTKLISQDSSRKTYHQVCTVLKNILIFYKYLSLFIVIFVPFNSKFIFSMLLGNNWASSTDAFKVYWIYIPFLAVNGVTEATFYSTVEDATRLFSYSKYMVVCSIAFITSATLLIKGTGLSVVGLIIANCVNMLLRIIYCSNLINSMDSSFKLHIDSSSLQTILVGMLVASLHYFITGSDTENFVQFFYSVSLAFLTLLSVIFTERTLLSQLFHQVWKSKIKSS